MKFTSKVALAIALAAGLSTTAMVTPAVAQKKNDKKQQGGDGLKLTDAVRKSVSAAQTAIAANDTATAETNLAAAEAAAATDDDRYIIAALRLPIAAKTNDRAKMIPILDQLAANPKTPAADLPRYTYFRGALAFEQKKYAEALPFLQRAQQLGYQESNMALQIAQAQVETGNVAGGITAIQTAIDAEKAAGRKAPESWYNYAIAKLYGAGDRAGTAKWLAAELKEYPTAQNWRKSILVYRDNVKGTKPLDKGQRIDLFRLMRATKSLADQGDYLEYATDANMAGLPYEAKAVLAEGQATGKIPAGNSTASQLLAEANNSIKADTPLATLEKNAGTSANGKLASQTADVYLAQGNYAKAITLYELALQKGGVDASEVNLRLGMALTQAGQKDAARAAFAKVTAAPRSDMAVFWQSWLDQGATVAPAAAQ